MNAWRGGIAIVCLGVPFLLIDSGDAGAADAGSRILIDELIQTLPGEYDSGSQLRAEEVAGVPKDLRHGRVYRSFTRIDAPEVGQYVVVNNVRYGGPEGSFDAAEFQAWILKPTESGNAVSVSPMRFRDPDRYMHAPGKASTYEGLAPSDLAPPEGSAACDIEWRRVDGGLLGTTEADPCVHMSYTMNVPLAWAWRYFLAEDAFWITFAGRNDAGEIVNGRSDQLPWRLARRDHGD